MKEKQKNRKLLLLVMLFVITGFILGTSSYAWFTANKNVKVDDISLNVSATSGIQVSADAINWKSVVDKDMLLGVSSTTYKSAINQIPDETNSISPVSSVGEVSNGKMNMFYGQVDTSASDYKLTATKEVEKDGNSGKFIAFDLFLKIDSEDGEPVPVYLSGNSKIEAGTTATGIESSSRVAFVKLGETQKAGTSIATIQGLTGSTSDSSATTVIWEPNYDVHSQTGIDNAVNVYGEKTTLTKGANNPLLSYNGIKAEIKTGVNLDSSDSAYFTKITPAITTKNGSTANQTLFTLDEGITKLRVYMWVEGQDVDCENNASGGNITYDIQFTTESD